jgi:hypothetical protein
MARSKSNPVCGKVCPAIERARFCAICRGRDRRQSAPPAPAREPAMALQQQTATPTTAEYHDPEGDLAATEMSSWVMTTADPQNAMANRSQT